MNNFIGYAFYKLKARYYLMKANAKLKYYESIPYRRMALHYELRAQQIKHGNKKHL